jgi:RimJ/RimL family protein N-acetyltransferase
VTVIRVAQLMEQDWRAFAIVRLQALTDSLGPTDPQYRREASFTASQWRRRLREHAAFTILVDDRPMGLISAQHETADSVYLYSLWLAPDARGHGLARSLLEAAVDWARTQQVHTVTLRVDPDNSVARGVYEKAGFKVAAATVGPRHELAMSLTV